MGKYCTLVTVGVLMLFCSACSIAGHIDLPVKWSQLPEMGTAAYDLRAEHPIEPGGQIVADDWMCNDPNPIIAVRWWGSYLNPQYEPTAQRYLPFEMSIHVGDTEPPPSSTPGPLDKLFMVSAQEHWYGADANGINVYEYNVYIEPYYQTMDQVYWLDIELDVGSLGWPYYTWGWHNTYQPWGDKTCFSTVSHDGPWNIDCDGQAFELMVPEPGSFISLTCGALGLAGWMLKRRRRE